MKPRALLNLGVPKGELLKRTVLLCAEAGRAGLNAAAIRAAVTEVLRDPEAHTNHPQFAELAEGLLKKEDEVQPAELRAEQAPWLQWGENLEPQSIAQLNNACLLPIAVRGALMPDAHLGYGLPIGGVLATDNAIIPYAVGVDIACRMKLTVLDLPVTALDGQRDRLIKAIESETRFGVGSSFEDRRSHDVLDDDWSITEVTARLRDKAWSQLGTSGSGNHFVEFGTLTVDGDQPDLNLDAGVYIALLSHSGSRGIGAAVAGEYSKRAVAKHKGLPKNLRQLAWFDLDSADGIEYWNAMQLMGRYAAANHALIHHHIARHLGAHVRAEVENHHNFAWKEVHDGREVIVHRKGATPAGAGVLGVIPGSMATPGYIVRGRGSDAALHSASHGAGRAMSRTATRSSQTWSSARAMLRERNVHLISADLDEVPAAYKDIEAVMAAQRDLVEVVARFDPRIVKMSPPGEQPED
jgi:tRNA-splicing ligase RtcB